MAFVGARFAVLAGALVASGVVPSTVRAEAVVTVASRALAMRDDPVYLAKRKFSWSVRSGLADPAHQIAAPVAGSDGDPTTAGATGGGGVLTVYDSAGSGESFTVVLPAGRWQQQGAASGDPRYVYAADAATEPLWKIWIKGTKLTVRGGRRYWGYTLDEPSQGSIAVRLTLGTGVTYCADVLPRTSGSPPSSAAYDRAGRFTGQPNAPAPATCPPVP